MKSRLLLLFFACFCLAVKAQNEDASGTALTLPPVAMANYTAAQWAVLAAEGPPAPKGRGGSSSGGGPASR